MSQEQFLQAVKLLFCVGTTGRALLDDLRKTYARPFTNDPYKTAFNLGAQDLIHMLMEIADE